MPTRFVESDVEDVSSTVLVADNNLVELLNEDGNEDVEKALQLL